MVVIPIALICEYVYAPCCRSALAATQLAIEDANNKNAAIIPEFGNLVQNLTMKLSAAADPYDEEFFHKMMGWWKQGGEGVAALIGPYYSSSTLKYAHVAASNDVAQVSWATAPGWQDNPLYPGVFRLSPTDARSALATYRLIEKRNIAALALLYRPSDAWSVQMKDTIVNACKDGSHKCTVSVFETGFHDTEEIYRTILLQIRAGGIRTIVNLGEEQTLEPMYMAGNNLGMVGAGASAAGYLWIHNNFIFNYPADKTYLYEGALKVLFTNHLVKSERQQTFVSHWKANVPRIRQFPAFGPLQVPDAHDPMTCGYFTSQAYDGVARVRIAADKVSFSGLSPHPYNGEAQAARWYGTEILKELQRGTTMDGIVQGPKERKSQSIGMPWIESKAPHYVSNYLNAANPEVLAYELDQAGGLVPSPTLNSAILPGGIGFVADTSVGSQLTTPCNQANARPCRDQRSFGTCQLEALHIGANDGWCKCDYGKVGKYCNYDGPAFVTPAGVTGQKEVEVLMSAQVTGFQDFSSDGKAFLCNIDVYVTWEDPRFPWEDALKQTGVDYYNEAMTETLLDGIWVPAIHLTGRIQGQTRKLKVKRAGESVTLTLMMSLSIMQDHLPDFSKFPFDAHELSTQISIRQSGVRMLYTAGSLVHDSAPTKWNNQWSWNRGEHGEKWVEMTGELNNFHLFIRVSREYKVLVFRIVIPITILSMTSWAAFWIPPEKLMPRFASGFISFLALQPFKTMSLGLMPNKGIIDDMSWIDVYISVVGFLMGFAVLETVMVQYIVMLRSNRVGRNVDIAARGAFPFTFVVFVIFMCLDLEVSSVNVVVHVWIALFLLLFVLFAFYEVRYAMVLLVRRRITRKGSVAERYRPVQMSENELHTVFDDCNAFCKLHRDKNKQLTTDQYIPAPKLAEWLIYACPRLASIRNHVEDLIKEVFKDEKIHFPVFKNSFTAFLVDLTLVFNEDPAEIEKIMSARLSVAANKSDHAPRDDASKTQPNEKYSPEVDDDEEEEGYSI